MLPAAISVSRSDQRLSVTLDIDDLCFFDIVLAMEVGSQMESPPLAI